MTPEDTDAIQEIQGVFPGCRVDVADDGAGGAFVTVHDIPLDEGPFAQAASGSGFKSRTPIRTATCTRISCPRT